MHALEDHEGGCWLARLQALLVRFSHLGIGGDIASMSLVELWALYLHLVRLGNG